FRLLPEHIHHLAVLTPSGKELIGKKLHRVGKMSAGEKLNVSNERLLHELPVFRVGDARMGIDRTGFRSFKDPSVAREEGRLLVLLIEISNQIRGEPAKGSDFDDRASRNVGGTHFHARNVLGAKHACVRKSKPSAEFGRFVIEVLTHNAA